MTKSFVLLCAFSLATAATPAASQAPTPAGKPAPTAPDARGIERALRPVGRLLDRPDTSFALEDRMRYWHVPGVSVAVIDDFKVVFARGYGVTEFGSRTPVDTTTLFQAGSISKPVFASGALKLVEQGKLQLDGDVNAQLKSWKLPESNFTATEKVTLKRLLTHSAGLTVWGFPGYASDVTVPTVPQVLDGAGNTPAVRNDTIPGARWLYSGGGFTIAQLLATDVTGEPFPSLMRRLVLDPAGMKRSTYENPLPASHARAAASGHERIDTPVPGRYHTYPEMAAAGLWTTASDLARWAIAISRAYNGDTKGILSPAMTKQMVTKVQSTAPRGGLGFYGLGVAVDGEGDSISFSHGGRDEGFVAHLMMWPKLGRGYVIMTNGVSGALLNEFRRAFAETYGVGAGSVARSERRLAEVDTAALAALAGRYVAMQGRDTVTLDVSHSTGALLVNNHFGKRQFRLWPLGNDYFFDMNTGGTLVFQRDSTTSRGKTVRMGLAVTAPVAVRQ